MYGENEAEEEPRGGGDGQSSGCITHAEAPEGNREEGYRDPVGAGTGAAGYVYFIETDDAQFVKIGFSRNVHQRFTALRGGVPGGADLHLIGYMPGTTRDEFLLHEQFRAHRVRGEWFRHLGDLREFIAGLTLSQPVISAAATWEADEQNRARYRARRELKPRAEDEQSAYRVQLPLSDTQWLELELDAATDLSVSEPLPLRDGAIPLGDATIRDLRNSRSLIREQEKELARERAEARIVSLDKIIASMSPFARYRRGLTVAQWCAMAAASGEAVAQARWGKGKA